VAISDDVAATSLYRIAQEAVANAVKHGSPRCIRITLARRDDRVTLAIENDGADFADPFQQTDGPTPAAAGRTSPAREGGMGLRLMQYRARTIGALLDVRRGERGGTRVACSLPLAPLREAPRNPSNQE